MIIESDGVASKACGIYLAPSHSLSIHFIGGPLLSIENGVIGELKMDYAK